MSESPGDGNPLVRHGGLSYLEIPARDAERSAAFYQRLFGWRIERRADNDYRFSDGNGLLIGRWLVDRAASGEPGMMPIFYVDGLEVAVGRVTANGGEIVKPPCTEGDVMVARIRDPAGNPIGLWQFVPADQR